MSREEDRVIDLVKTVRHILWSKEISPTGRLILIHLVQVMTWTTCEAKTTHIRIAKELKIGEKTVRRQLKILEDMDLIQVTNTKARGLNDANIYKLLPKTVVPKLLESQSGQNDHTSGQNDRQVTQNRPKSLESLSGQNDHTSGQNDHQVPVKMTATIGQNDHEVPVKMTEHIHSNNHTNNHTNTYINNPNTNTHGVTETGQQGYNPKVRGKKLLEMDRAKAQTRQQQRQPQQQRQHQPETRVITLPRSGRQVTQTRQPNGGWI